MQIESPDAYISRIRRHVAEQIRQDNIARKKLWMDELKSITVMLLLFAFAVLVLAGLAAAEPQPVDGGWHRSDEVPIEIETPTAAPTESDADAAATTVAEPQPGGIMIEPEAAEQRGDMRWYVISWVVFSCMGLAVVWIAVILMRGGAKR
jgi:hypothetical protein